MGVAGADAGVETGSDLGSAVGSGVVGLEVELGRTTQGRGF